MPMHITSLKSIAAGPPFSLLLPKRVLRDGSGIHPHRRILGC